MIEFLEWAEANGIDLGGNSKKSRKAAEKAAASVWKVMQSEMAEKDRKIEIAKTVILEVKQGLEGIHK